jgi:hypothetical protein
MEVVDHDRRPAGSFAESLTIAAAVVPDHHEEGEDAGTAARHTDGIMN